MEETHFKELFQSLVDRCELTPDIAAELLQSILAVLKNREKKPLQAMPKHETTMEQRERRGAP